jgi:hypothetical protein
MGIDDGQPLGTVHAFEKVKGSEFPPLVQSRRLALGNITALFGAGGTGADGNRWFAVLMGVLYLFSSALSASGLSMLLMFLIFGTLCMAIGWEALQEVSPKWPAWRRYGLTIGSSLTHTLCHCGLAWSIAHILPVWVALGMFGTGALLGTLVFGTWLAVMSWCGYLTNNGFSALALQDFKGFMRFKISADGTLHGYFVAIDKTPRQWKIGIHKRPIWEPAPCPLVARVHDSFTLQKSAVSGAFQTDVEKYHPHPNPLPKGEGWGEGFNAHSLNWLLLPLPLGEGWGEGWFFHISLKRTRQCPHRQDGFPLRIILSFQF